MSDYVKSLVRQARQSSYKLANLSTARKNRALRRMAAELVRRKKYILAENKKDIAKAHRVKLNKSFIDRLALTEERINQMSRSLDEVAVLPDPVGKVIFSTKRPNGIRLSKVRVPIGVVLIVYEARPNVTSDCAGLLFKTSNVGILRGGSSALHSNAAIGNVLNEALKKSGVGFSPLYVVSSRDRSLVDELLTQDAHIDLVIPRGGESLIRKVVRSSHIPVIKHYKGVCHLYIDESADIAMALRICVNAKVQRPSVCNAVETILVHRKIAPRLLPRLKKEFDSFGVTMRADGACRKIVKGLAKAGRQDWETEYLDLIVSVGIVNGVDEAIEHINAHGSHHTDSIITRNKRNAERFIREVDSACCFANISTRLSDGFEFGLGAEIGISTDKLHARGPMGLEELTSYKWVARGNGQIRK